jgi:hypothetical protein
MNRKYIIAFVLAVCVAAFLMSKTWAAQTDLTDFVGAESNYYKTSTGDTLRVGVVAKHDTVFAYGADNLSITMRLARLGSGDTLCVNLEKSADGIHFIDFDTDSLTVIGDYAWTVTNVDLYPWLVMNLSQAGVDTADVAPLIYRVGRKLQY